jgi:hypothetical protein
MKLGLPRRAKDDFAALPGPFFDISTSDSMAAVPACDRAARSPWRLRGASCRSSFDTSAVAKPRARTHLPNWNDTANSVGAFEDANFGWRFSASWFAQIAKSKWGDARRCARVLPLARRQNQRRAARFGSQHRLPDPRLLTPGPSASSFTGQVVDNG